MEPIKLPSFPVTAYHPVFGARTANNMDEARAVFTGDASDWFATAAEADAARTQREAEIVTHYRTSNRIAGIQGKTDEIGHELVENSVQADQRIRAGLAEP